MPGCLVAEDALEFVEKEVWVTAHLATGPIQEPEKSQAPPRNGSKTSGCGVMLTSD